MIGIAQPSMQKILAGETRNPRKIVEIAKELGTTPDYLLYGDMTVSHSTLENSQINNNQGQTVNNFFLTVEVMNYARCCISSRFH